MDKNKAFFSVIAAGVLWGTSGIFAPLLSSYGFDCLQIAFLRTFSAAFLLLFYILLTNRTLLYSVKPKELLLFFGNGISFLAMCICYYAAMKLTTVSTAVILLYTAPIGVMIFSVLFLGERFTGKKCIALVCMMIGCFLVSVVGSLSFQAMGVLLGILSGIFYSTYSIFSKIEMRKGSDPVTATFYCFVFASLIGSVVCHTGDIPKLVLSDSVGILLVILLMGLCTAVLPYVLYSIGLKYLPAGTASALAIVEPLSATIFGITLLDEPITGASAGGMLLIFGSIYLLSRNDRHL